MILSSDEKSSHVPVPVLQNHQMRLLKTHESCLAFTYLITFENLDFNFNFPLYLYRSTNIVNAI